MLHATHEITCHLFIYAAPGATRRNWNEKSKSSSNVACEKGMGTPFPPIYTPEYLFKGIVCIRCIFNPTLHHTNPAASSCNELSSLVRAYLREIYINDTFAASTKLSHFICFPQIFSTFLADLTPKRFRDLSNHSLCHGMNVRLPSRRTIFYHSSFFLKASRLCNSLPIICWSTRTKFISFQSKYFYLWKVALRTASLWRDLRATSRLCVLSIRHSPLNPDYKRYPLCSCGLSRTAYHILL